MKSLAKPIPRNADTAIPTPQVYQRLLAANDGWSALAVAWVMLLLITCCLVFSTAANAETNKTNLHVSARVMSFFRLQISHQSESLVITERDIRRGYVDVPAATHFSVTTNEANGFVVDFQPKTDMFVSVRVTGLQSPAELGASGGSVSQSSPIGRASSHQLDYRFIVGPGALPGTYPWPMMVSVRSV